jgi:hypothetical protein
VTDVRSNEPSEAAASPAHVDHPRWLKARTLAMEVAHASKRGGTLREAEAANATALARLEVSKRAARPVLAADKVANARRREERRDQLGVVKRPVAPPPPVIDDCKCNACQKCARRARLAQIMLRARQGDTAMRWLADNLVALHLAFQKRIDAKIAPSPRARCREVGFSRMRLNAERNLAFIGAVDSICDWSTRALGGWRK